MDYGLSRVERKFTCKQITSSLLLNRQAYYISPQYLLTPVKFFAASFRAVLMRCGFLLACYMWTCKMRSPLDSFLHCHRSCSPGKKFPPPDRLINKIQHEFGIHDSALLIQMPHPTHQRISVSTTITIGMIVSQPQVVYPLQSIDEYEVD